jgi:hypothetical protein
LSPQEGQIHLAALQFSSVTDPDSFKGDNININLCSPINKMAQTLAESGLLMLELKEERVANGLRSSSLVFAKQDSYIENILSFYKGVTYPSNLNIFDFC